MTLLLLGSLIVTLSGCASKSPSASVPTPANVNGTWTGSTVSGDRTVTLELQQTGTNVKRLSRALITGDLGGGSTLNLRRVQ